MLLEQRMPLRGLQILRHHLGTHLAGGDLGPGRQRSDISPTTSTPHNGSHHRPDILFPGQLLQLHAAGGRFGVGGEDVVDLLGQAVGLAFLEVEEIVASSRPS